MQKAVRVAIRSLIRRPAFALTIIVSLAIGAGANAAIIGTIYATLLSEPPFGEPHELVTLQDSRQVPSYYRLSRSDVSALVRSLPASMSAASWSAGGGFEARVTARGTTASAVEVSPQVFTVLRARPSSGRVLLALDTLPAARPVVVLSHSLHRRIFGSDSWTESRFVRVGSIDHRVIGVMPRGFWFPGWNYEAWIPPRDPADDGSRRHSLIIRVAGEPSPAAESTLVRLGERVVPDTERPRWWRSARFTAVARPGDAKQILAVQLGAFIVLLLGCSNAGHLFMIRELEGSRETWVRWALGGGRVARTGWLLAEMAVLALVTGVVSVALALVGVTAVATSLGRHLLGEVISGAVLVIMCAATVSAVAAVMASGLPAAVSSLRGEGRLTLDGRDPPTVTSRAMPLRWRLGLVLQVAMAMALLSGGLFAILPKDGFRDLAGLLLVLSTMSIFLALVGVAGSLGHYVHSTRRQFAIRMALGATPGHIGGRVMREAIAIVGTGVVLGGGASLLVIRFLRNLLGDATSSVMPITLSAGFILAAGIATAVPLARRAARVSLEALAAP